LLMGGTLTDVGVLAHCLGLVLSRILYRVWGVERCGCAVGCWCGALLGPERTGRKVRVFLV
jgi:hypothetical protein